MRIVRARPLLFLLLVGGTASTLELVSGRASAAGLVLGALLALALWVGSRILAARREPRRRAARAVLETPPGVSVVIPARNEQGYLEEAIRSVRRQSIPVEVVVVENGSSDGTAAIARRMADRVVERDAPLGYSRARNLGAAAAGRDWLVFLDADSRMGPGALEAIFAHALRGEFGTVLGRPDRRGLGYWIFFASKNLWHRLGLYKGALGGLLFCDAELFRRIRGFDENLAIDEIHEFSRRARASGGRYVLATNGHAITSMRRFADVGLMRSLWYWCCLRFGISSGERFHSWRTGYSTYRHRALPGAAPDVRSAALPDRRRIRDLRAHSPAEL